MTFRHIVLFQWADDIDDDYVDAIRAGFDSLPAQIPQIRGYVHGADLAISEGNYDYALIADFDSVDDWRTYREHPAHVLFLAETVRGKVKARAGVQLTLPNAPDPFAYSAARMQELLAEPDELG